MQAGIGKRRDGWPNRDLDVGKIISLSPALTAEQKKVYTSWGPGKYDPRYNQDGKNNPLVIPPAYGLAHVKNETYTAEGPISYWNAYVAVTQMGGQGNFSDQRLKIDVKHSPDLVTSKLPALRAYQHSLPAPRAAASSYDAQAAERGKVTFNRTCATCHVGGNGTDNDSGKLHAPADTGMNSAYAMRTANRRSVRPRCAACSTIRRTSMTAARRHSETWWSTTTRNVRSISPRTSRRDLVEYLKSL